MPKKQKVTCLDIKKKTEASKQDPCPKNKTALLHKRGAKGAEGGQVNRANKTGRKNGCPCFFEKEHGYDNFFLENFQNWHYQF